MPSHSEQASAAVKLDRLMRVVIIHLFVALQVQNDPEKALMLARENWKIQREPRDAQIFLEATLVAKNSTVAQPVRRATGITMAA